MKGRSFHAYKVSSFRYFHDVFSCFKRYSFSKFSLASFKGASKDFSKISLSLLIFDDEFKISLTNLFIFSLLSFDDNIVILSTKFLNSLTLPGQL